MKTIIILFFFVLVGCSKSSAPQPDITGHWIGSSTTFSANITITKSGTAYQVTGSFSISGKTTIMTNGIATIQPGGTVAREIVLNTNVNGVPVLPSLLLAPVMPSSDYNTLKVEGEMVYLAPGQGGPYSEQFNLVRN